MNLYCIKCSKFTKNNNIKENANEMEKKIFIPVVVDCGFEKFETIYKEEIGDLWKFKI